MSKPKIIICGQKPRRHEELERQFGRRARLTFYYESSLHQLRDRARHADAVFVCLDATSHKVVQLLRSAGAAPRMVGGATENLRRALEQYLG